MIENENYSAVKESTEKWLKSEGDPLTIAFELLAYAQRLEHKLGIDSRLLNKYRHKLKRIRQ